MIRVALTFVGMVLIGLLIFVMAWVTSNFNFNTAYWDMLGTVFLYGTLGIITLWLLLVWKDRRFRQSAIFLFLVIVIPPFATMAAQAVTLWEKSPTITILSVIMLLAMTGFCGNLAYREYRHPNTVN